MASIRLKKNPLVYQQGGGMVQDPGPWDPWLPAVENSRLFVQRMHGARCAPLVAPEDFLQNLTISETLVSPLVWV